MSRSCACGHTFKRLSRCFVAIDIHHPAIVPQAHLGAALSTPRPVPLRRSRQFCPHNQRAARSLAPSRRADSIGAECVWVAVIMIESGTGPRSAQANWRMRFTIAGFTPGLSSTTIAARGRCVCADPKPVARAHKSRALLITASRHAPECGCCRRPTFAVENRVMSFHPSSVSYPPTLMCVPAGDPRSRPQSLASDTTSTRRIGQLAARSVPSMLLLDNRLHVRRAGIHLPEQ